MTSKQINARRAVTLLVLGAIGGGGALWMIITATSHPLRTIHVPYGASSVVVDQQIGRAVVIGDGPGSGVSILDTHDGRVLHTLRLRGRLSRHSAVSMGTGHTFALSAMARYNVRGTVVYMLDTRTGALLRTVSVPLGPVAVAVDGRSGHVFVASMGATTNASRKGLGSVSVLDAHSGALARIVKVGLQPWAIAADAKTRRIFVANLSSNTVSVLDALTGRVVRTVTVGKAPYAVAVDQGTGRVFVANELGKTVSMLDAGSGKLLRTTRVGSLPVAIAVDDEAGRVVVANAGGTVSILDAMSGAVRTTIEVGGDPAALDIDARSHHAFITSTGNSSSNLLHHIGHGQLSWLGEWNNDYVTVLDTRSGTRLHTVRVPTSSDVAVDAHAGHAFVSTGDTVSMLDAAG